MSTSYGEGVVMTGGPVVTRSKSVAPPEPRVGLAPTFFRRPRRTDENRPLIRCDECKMWSLSNFILREQTASGLYRYVHFLCRAK